jgi:hypothetical protein
MARSIVYASNAKRLVAKNRRIRTSDPLTDREDHLGRLSGPESLLGLQRLAGNAAVTELIHRQTLPMVGKEFRTSGPANGGLVQRCPGCGGTCGRSNHEDDVQRAVLLEREADEDDEWGSGGDGSGSGVGSEWTGGGGTSAVASGGDSGAGSQWAAGPSADGSSGGSEWTAGPGADGSSAGSQWSAGPGADGAGNGTATDDSLDKWMEDPIGQLEQLGQDAGRLMGTGQPENVQDVAGGGDTGATDTDTDRDILADPSAALERAIGVVQKAISGYSAKESEEGLSDTEQGFVAALQNAVEQLSTLRGTDDGSLIATAVGPILGVAHFLEGASSAPPAGGEPTDGGTVQRIAILAPIAIAPVIIPALVITAIVAIGLWLLTRPATPRVPPEVSLQLGVATTAILHAMGILSAGTSLAITEAEAKDIEDDIDTIEGILNGELIDGFVKKLKTAGKCLEQILELSRAIKRVKALLEEPLDEIDRKALHDLCRAVDAAMEAFQACIQGVPGPGGGERQPANDNGPAQPAVPKAA